MRFVKVVVKNFQAIERAEVELGPGLNVLFGPNDLGKSTIATAIRAALLVPPTSSEAGRYLPWFADAVPEVTLTFVDDDGRFWRVKKCFGAASAQTSADLEYSKDGITFTRDCRGREVEDRLRTTLGWGIPSPGGKGGAKKPVSFLAHALLAEQSDVETILRQSTDEDGTASGKDRLRKALAALAEDPLFKRVLVSAQREVDTLFTPKGQRRRSRGSPFLQAADDVKRHAERVDLLKRAATDSRAAEEKVQGLQEQCSVAREAAEESAAALDSIRQQQARGEEKTRADERLANARSIVDGFRRQAADVAVRELAVQNLESAAKAAEQALAEARVSAESADAAWRGAEEALRAATSADGAREREVARARLGEERAENTAKQASVEVRRRALEAAQKAAAGVAAAKKTERDAVDAAAAAETAKREAEEDLELSRGILAYGEWRAADAAGTQASEATAKAKDASEDAARRDAEAQERETEAAALEAETRAGRERLPDPILLKRLVDLQQQIEVTEAALGGGFSLAVRGSGKVPLHVTLDGAKTLDGTAVDGRIVLEAERTATLRIGDLLDVDIVAGAAEKRKTLESLRERWANEALPILERANAKSPAELREQSQAIADRESSLARARSAATQLRTEARAARESATMHAQRATELLARGQDAAAAKARLTHDTAVLETFFAKLGDGWREQADALVRAKDRALTTAREKAEKAARESALATYRVKEADAKLAATENEERQVAGDGPDARARALLDAETELSALVSRHAAIEQEIRALERDASTAVDNAKAAVEEAKAKREEAAGHQTESSRVLDDARSSFHAARGEAETLRRALEAVDRAGADARVIAAIAELAVFADVSVVTVEQLQAAERRAADARATYDDRRAELLKAQGGLRNVGGGVAHEELTREEEALSLAKARQRELEVDADSWLLLRDTLHEVEKEGSTHLGRSLAAPVSARLVELTRGRYSGVRLDQHLRAETVDVPFVATDRDVLDALSVGTRDQIATLLRVTIAEHLESAVILDDHLVHTDPERLAWFCDVLRKTALVTQVVVLTCRPHDYFAKDEFPDGAPVRDLAGGAVRAVDVSRVLRRFGQPSPVGGAASEAGSASSTGK